MKDKEVSLFWFRRDLRVNDNVGLFHALKENSCVLPIFIFDNHILEGLPKEDARVSYIFDRLQELRNLLQDKYDSSISIHYGDPLKIFRELDQAYNLKNVYTNHDYEPYAKKRDQEISYFLSEHGIEFNTYKDQVIFEKGEVVKDDGTPYLVYTPYMKQWKATFNRRTDIQEHKTQDYSQHFIKHKRLPNLSLSELGFEKSTIKFPSYDVSNSLIKNYKATRNFPAKNGTSNLSPHLRFGTVSIRALVKKASEAEEDTFLNELIWREFFMQILHFFPESITAAFKKKYDRIKWRNNKEEFTKWKEGKTGYPMVDAGMRQLNQTGMMHNRVRMVVGSFLCKHLLIDWRWGEAYFAEKLLDYELSSNVGNWQWVAGSGVDAAPYFRIFNPSSQLDKFDKNHEYIKKWIPEYGTDAYPEEIVDHKKARERCLRAYKDALN